MQRQLVFIACLWAVASTAEIKYPDGTYVQHYTTLGNGIAPANSVGGHKDGLHGFGVQTGYEGYLVPTKDSTEGTGWDFNRGLMVSLLPMAKLFMSHFPGGLWVLAALTLLVGGGLLCSFTPVCGFNPLGFGRDILNQESLNSATAFVMEAIEKHRDQQKTPAVKEKEE